MVKKVSKSYEPDRNLIVGITNQIVGGSNAGVVSSFTYMNDDLSRRTRRNDQRSMGVSPVSSCWEYGYNSRSELTNAVRRLPDTIPVAGQSKSYLYDNIGNRRKVSGNGHEALELYVANELNQYVVRIVPSYVDVIGTATNIATVTVRDAAHTDLPAPVIRQDDYFYKAYPVDNLSGFFSGDLEISAVINPSGTNVPDIVKTEARSTFVPQTPEQYIYDDDGTMLSDGRFDYVWNGENRLITVSNQTGLVASYAYDYLGRRISKTVGSETTTFLWNGNHIISEISNGPSQITNVFVWGQNDHLVSATLGGTNVFYCHDGNKNVTDLVDASGNGVAQYEFDPYGNINVKTGVLADANPFRFSNEYYDPETGHVAFMLRYLDTITGSWLNRDPIGVRGGLNVYGFVGNNPVDNIDLFGLDFVAVGRAPVGLTIRGRDFGVAGHMSIIFFEEKTRCPTEGTDFAPADVGAKGTVFAVAVQKDQYELLPSHHQYVQKYTVTTTVDLPGLDPKTITIPIYEPVSVSFIENSASPTKLHVIYADTRDGKVKDAKQKWSVIAQAAKSYAYAEQPPRGKAILSNWPNSKYRLPNQNPGNNSNTLVHYMAALISRSADVFNNTPGDKRPSAVSDLHPTPVLWKIP